MDQLITTTAQLGEILRRRRGTRKLSQATLASKLGISQGRFSVLEADPAPMSLERFLMLANLLGIDVLVRDESAVPVPTTEW